MNVLSIYKLTETVDKLKERIDGHNVYIKAFNDMWGQQQTFNDKMLDFMSLQVVYNVFIGILVFVCLYQLRTRK